MAGTRRGFLGGAAGIIAGASAWPFGSGAARASLEEPPGLRFGACVVDLEQGREAGLDGVEVPVGGPAETLEISRPEVRRRYREQMKRTGLPISSLMMGLLNGSPLASDPRGPSWLDQSIDAAHDLGAKVILVAFFGNGDLLGRGGEVKEDDVKKIVEHLRSAAPKAKQAGVILGIENYLDARRNAEILDAIDHPSVKIYYDCYNTGATRGYDVPAEIRMLKDRIVQFHFKNGPDFLDSGKLRFEPIAAAIREIGYRGWIVLETSSPTRDAVADARRNAAYARKLFA
ncbi:MAG: sugar phosphate isomerase/epimerase family protein [Isosphaeraceae bacterium]